MLVELFGLLRKDKKVRTVYQLLLDPVGGFREPPGYGNVVAASSPALHSTARQVQHVLA
jgi:hypothetical protein